MRVFNDNIFVQIASYRDRDLPNTINSALSTARDPGNLRFGICWQYDDVSFTDLDPWLPDPRFRISQHYYEDSRGCCWARNITNSLYRDERFTLQIDAHTRFAPGWDAQYRQMLTSVDSDKPLLTTYPAPFETVDGSEHLNTDRGIQKLTLGRIRRNLTTLLKTTPVETSEYCVPSPFIAAGQIFTLGRFCEEVEYDPELYFDGEEIALSARAYTSGYDFYCPNVDVIWHRYQHAMPLHWSDHQHQENNETAMNRLCMLLLGEHDQLGRYGLGNARSLAEYEQYCGIDFLQCSRRPYVPTHFKDSIELDVSKIPDRSDYDYWIFSLKNQDEKEIYRFDIKDKRILNKLIRCVDLDVHLEDIPTTYMLWPYVRSLGYLAQHNRELA